MDNLTKREIARHPILAGVAMLVLGPYILAFVLIFAALYVAAAAIDMLAGSHR